MKNLAQPFISGEGGLFEDSYEMEDAPYNTADTTYFNTQPTGAISKPTKREIIQRVLSVLLTISIIICTIQTLIAAFLFFLSFAFLNSNFGTLVVLLIISIPMLSIALCCLFPLYIAYWVEISASQAFHIFKNAVTVTEARAILRQMKDNIPEIIFKATSYHYESKVDGKRKRSVSGRFDSHMKQNNLMLTKVTSHIDSDFFPLSAWNDVSKDWSVEHNPPFPIIKLNIFKHFTFGDEVTKSQFEQAMEKFKLENRSKDDYMDFECELYIPHYRECLWIVLDEHHIAKRKSSCLSLPGY